MGQSSHSGTILEEMPEMGGQIREEILRIEEPSAVQALSRGRMPRFRAFATACVRLWTPSLP
jgi:hypothetical protein